MHFKLQVRDITQGYNIMVSGYYTMFEDLIIKLNDVLTEQTCSKVRIVC